MISMNDRQIRQYESDLNTFAKAAFPYATAATVNTAAFNTRKVSRDFISRRFISRNHWTRGSIRVNRTREKLIARQRSEVGSTEEYMALQERGGLLEAKGDRHPIPTPYASGEASIPRRKLPPRSKRFRNITISKNRKNNRAAVHEAAKGSKYAYLDLGRRSGIYRVTGKGKRLKIRKMYDLSRDSVRIPATKWLEPSTDKITPRLPQYYGKALVYQLRRHRALGY